MPTQSQPQPSARLAFGPFEVNASCCELRKSGFRVRLSGQPFQILLILLAHPGEVVTREQLCEHIWNDGTFVDFEHGLHAAMNKLRRALNDSAGNPRYVETVSGRGYRFIGTIEPSLTTTDLETPAPPSGGPVMEILPRRRTSFGAWWLLAAAIVCMGAFAALWRFHFGSAATLSPGKLTRLTSDSGLSDASALSPDDKLVAYSSDRDPEGGRDLYVKQIAGGQPVRLTFDGAGNTTPDFSPDGDRIVFRSNRDGGGIYEIPTFGGDARLLAQDGFNPRYSPDGTQVAYWVGNEGVALTVPGNGAVWVVQVSGRQRRLLAPNLTNARYPVWSPDGKHLLVVGYSAQKPDDYLFVDWWLIPNNGGKALRAGAYDAFIRASLQGNNRTITQSASIPLPGVVPRPFCWLRATNRIIFSAASENGDSQNIWEGGISPATGKLSGVFRRVTAGAGNEIEPSSPSGHALTFTTIDRRRAIWSLPTDRDHATPAAALERVTEGALFREHASLSGDARFVAFASAQPSRLNIWLHELATGKEVPVAASSFVQRYPLVNTSGTKVAFSSYENGKRLVYVSTPGGIPEKMCEGCLRATDWSSDEKSVLIFTASPYQVNLLDVATHQQTTILKHDKYNLLFARFSPDNRWVSFTVRVDSNRSWIAIAATNGPRPVPESAWIRIAEGTAEDWANWSTDGRTLYFTSPRDGHYCLWAQRIDTLTHRPKGEPYAVQHFHGRMSYQQGGWSAAGGRIAIVLVEDKGNVWMMSPAGER